MARFLSALVLAVSLMGLGVGTFTLVGCNGKQEAESCPTCGKAAAECSCQAAETCEACGMATAECKCEK